MTNGSKTGASKPPLPRALLAEAAERMLAVRAAPEDAALDARTRAWIDADACHRRAWVLAERAWTASGDGLLALPRPANRNRWLRRAAALAACLVAVAGAPQALDALRADVTTRSGEQASHILDDGSRVVLAGGSAIDAQLGSSTRRVALLRGEAYFDVRRDPGRPFVVTADDMTVTVRGTAFDVAVGADTIAVAVAHGTVAVSVGKDEVILRGGDRLDYRRADRAVTVAAVDPGDVALWRQGRLVVSDVPLGEVLDALTRQNGGYMIAGGGLRARRVTGVFDLADAERALNALLAPQGAVAVKIGAGLWWLRQPAASAS